VDKKEETGGIKDFDGCRGQRTTIGTGRIVSLRLNNMAIFRYQQFPRNFFREKIAQIMEITVKIVHFIDIIT